MCGVIVLMYYCAKVLLPVVCKNKDLVKCINHYFNVGDKVIVLATSQIMLTTLSVVMYLTVTMVMLLGTCGSIKQ